MESSPESGRRQIGLKLVGKMSTVIKRTVISWKSIMRCVERLGDGLPGALGTEAWRVGVMIHKGNLLRGFVRRVKVSLGQSYQSFLGEWVKQGRYIRSQRSNSVFR